MALDEKCFGGCSFCHYLSVKGEEVEVHDINLDVLASQAQEVDGTGTVSKSEDRTSGTSQPSASSKLTDGKYQ